MSGGFEHISPRQLREMAEKAGITYEIEWGSPVFSHDCDACIFLGNYNYTAGGWGLVDLYYCPQSWGGGSIVYRYGNKGHEYGSMGLDLVLLRDANDNDEYSKSLRRIFTNDFNTYHTDDGKARRFRIKMVVEEIIETPCPDCGHLSDDEQDECRTRGCLKGIITTYKTISKEI